MCAKQKNIEWIWKKAQTFAPKPKQQLQQMTFGVRSQSSHTKFVCSAVVRQGPIWTKPLRVFYYCSPIVSMRACDRLSSVRFRALRARALHILYTMNIITIIALLIVMELTCLRGNHVKYTKKVVEENEWS